MKKILIANRGEIACRVIKTARKMGISTVAVYSDADRTSLHVKMADEAVHIGPPPSVDSYLSIEKIIDAAKATGADAIHPGYGFLSENDKFAEALETEDITFIGPSAHAIRVMGNKLDAKEAVKGFDIPQVPGSPEAVQSVEEGIGIAENIGWPVMIKAAAGGGGKGMRIVRDKESFKDQFRSAQSEALSAFANDAVFIEKYITSPRHIEIQILCDLHGNGVHLFERECSIQRRHQKVVEESPSVKLDDTLRHAMGTTALNVAKACNYSGAGTVEFIMDASGHYYFLEMNTRLQVEHPVTEMVTGVDLVEHQIRIARGEVLALTQEEMKQTGHAIELRVYAEDPLNNFLPSIGRLVKYGLPKGPNVRVDNGFLEGDEIPIYYDPMIAKLVTYGTTREEAIANMIRAISNYDIEGIETTLEFGRFCMQHKAFKDGTYDTHFVSHYFNPEIILDTMAAENKNAAKAALMHWIKYKNTVRIPH